MNRQLFRLWRTAGPQIRMLGTEQTLHIGYRSELTERRSMPFSIVALQSGVTRVSLEGDLAVSTVERLVPELGSVARRRPTEVEMELSRLRSISPRGVSVLLSFVGTMARAGCRVRVKGLRDQPIDTFKSRLHGAIANAARPVD